MSNYIADLAGRVNLGGMPELKHSTSRKNNTAELDMTDFLQLMVVQLQNQTIDNTMDTSDMLNQMVQMQMITALTNMTDASVMSYASSLVGKEVTIGDYSSGELVEKVVTITGSGMMDGEQVLFAGDDVYSLSSVMAVGRLPSKEEDGEGDETDKVEGSDKTEGTDKTEGSGKTEGTDKTEGSDKTEGTDKVEGSGKTEGTGNSESSGGAGNTGKTESAGSSGGGTLSGMIADETIRQNQVQLMQSFLRACRVSFPSNATEEDLNELVDNYFEAIESLGENSSARQDAVQAARTFLAENHVNLAEDATDDEILRAAMAILRAERVETSEDAAAEEKSESGTGESVAEVSASEQEAAAQDAE